MRTTVFRLDTLDEDRRSKRDALRIVRERPQEAIRLRIGRIDDPPGSRWSDGGLIDVNNTAVPVLCRFLNLDPEATNRLASLRSAGQSVRSVADLELHLSLDPYLLDPVRDRLIFLPLLGHPWTPSGTTGITPSVTSEGRASGIPTTSAGFRVHAVSWLWAISPLITAGLAAAPAFAFAAVRLKRRPLWSVSATYLSITLFLALADGLFLSSNWDAVGLWAVGGLATVHALLMRRDVFEVDIVRSDRIKRQTARHLADTDPQEAIRLQIGRIDIPESNRYPDGGLIDMNNVPVPAMCSTTGIDEPTAQRIVATREAIWGFKNLVTVQVPRPT